MKSIIIFLLGTTINLLSWIAPALSIRLSEYIFCKPHRRKVTPRQLKLMEQSQKDHFLVEGLKQTYFRWASKGKGILFLHGWESNSGRWAPLFSVLKNDNYNMSALDAPAHGQSEGSQFTAIRYAASIDKMVQVTKPKIIVAHSVGALAALIYLNQYKSASQIEKVVLMAPTNHMMEVLKGYQKVLGMTDYSLKLLTDHFERKYQVSFDSMTGEKLSKTVKQKCLLIHDKDDDVINIKGSEAIAQSLEHVEFIATTGLGHKLISGKVYRKIAMFLKD